MKGSPKMISLGLFLISTFPLFTQPNFQITAGFGISQLNHATRFETTPMHNVYQFVAISHRPEKYKWEDFEEDFELNSTVVQPRFGLHVSMTFNDKIPVFIFGEALSSTSSYEKMAYGFGAGIGKDFYVPDSSVYFSLNSGYKFVVDNGFGSRTLVNSIGNVEARELAATFFDPKEPIGSNIGQLLFVRGGIGRSFQQFKIGAEIYGELDLTDKLIRESRMTNIGGQIYFRFSID